MLRSGIDAGLAAAQWSAALCSMKMAWNRTAEVRRLRQGRALHGSVRSCCGV